jgi:nucleotide-binding universal stress UspA family protein
MIPTKKIMKTIIVPVDFSDYSEFALKTAASLAKNNKAEIIAMHMLDLQTALMNESESYQLERSAFLLKLAKKRFKAFLNKEYLKDVKVVPMVKHFKIFSEVNDVAKQENADLIVMGSHGATGFKELFLGSNTEKVIRFSDIPVLIVKNNPENFQLKNVVYATDLSMESVGAYVQMKSIIEDLGGKLHIVHVNTPYDNFRTTAEMEIEARDFFQTAEGNQDLVKEVAFVCDRTVEKGILNHAQSVNADLIAVSTHARKGLSHVFRGSLSEDIANHAQLPIMTVKM